MKNFDIKSLEKMASEAFDLYKKISSDNKKLHDLKKKISEASVGKNSSYKIPLNNVYIFFFFCVLCGYHPCDTQR